MDRSRALRIAGELAGKALGAWTVGKYIDNGKSALVVETSDAEGNKAALKIFDPDIVEEAGEEVQLERIHRELSLIGKSHPHLIRILDGGHAKDLDYFYVVMEYCPGETIAGAIHKIPPAQIRPLMRQLAAAARFLHDQSLVHRDIKPENVRLKENLTYAVLLDLGVTKPIGTPGATDKPTRHPFLGTRRYSPPEFLRRREKNTVEGWMAVTFYQLGGVLHDMLMRKPLFEGHEPEANLIEAVIHVVPEIRGEEDQQDLVQLCKACLQKDPLLRLKLVDWASFEFTATQRDDIPALLRRISDAQLLRTKGNRQTVINSEARKALSGILGRIESQVRKECAASGVIPPFAVHKLQSAEPRVGLFHVSFAKQKGLSFSLTIIFEVTLLELETNTIEVGYCALGHQTVLDQSASNFEFREFFAGAYDEQGLTKPLRVLLYALYEKAISSDPSEFLAGHREIIVDPNKAPKPKRV